MQYLYILQFPTSAVKALPLFLRSRPACGQRPVSAPRSAGQRALPLYSSGRLQRRPESSSVALQRHRHGHEDGSEGTVSCHGAFWKEGRASPADTFRESSTAGFETLLKTQCFVLCGRPNPNNGLEAKAQSLNLCLRCTNTAYTYNNSEEYVLECVSECVCVCQSVCQRVTL